MDASVKCQNGGESGSKSAILKVRQSATSALPSPCGYGEPATATSFSQSIPVPSLLVFSGGTAFNGVVEELKKFTTRVAHVLPVSDDGGSTAEIVRVLGGPAVGDIRSRCLRLSDESTSEAMAVKRLLGHRLPMNEQDAKAEWYEIVEGEHALWQGVSGPYRETIRAFLVHFQTEILRHPSARFNFRNGSIGNFFFAGARVFLQSLEAAIFLYSRVCQCPTDSFVLPAICTNDRLTLGSELHDGTIIKGQNEISHPIAKDTNFAASHIVNKLKHTSNALPSPIKRIFYMSSEGTHVLHEVFPVVNSAVLEQLRQVDAIVYGMGSLYTSICPSLVLRGVGETIARRTCPKILIINGSHDRETSGMSASDIVISVCNALNRKYCNDPQHLLQYPASHYVNVVLVPKGGEIRVDYDKLTAMNISTVTEVSSVIDERVGVIYKPKALISAIKRILRHHLVE
ncbi:hypothetical protein R1flu_001076 [Riccia fluitans]|uniref:LPPG:FO 2-phospho-L-lactate transferase CofD/UPF0052 n=1 Tax=Riccia fluitans TaxID=41844 RepID=A0ABD1Y2A0_9MARC